MGMPFIYILAVIIITIILIFYFFVIKRLFIGFKEISKYNAHVLIKVWLMSCLKKNMYFSACVAIPLPFKSGLDKFNMRFLIPPFQNVLLLCINIVCN